MGWRPPPFDLEAHKRERAQWEEGARKSDAEYKTLAARDPRGPEWLRFPIWYVGITCLYGALTLTGSVLGFILQSFPPFADPHQTIITAFLGLFVPIGPNNFIFFFLRPLSWIALAIIVMAIWKANGNVEYSRPTPLEKIYWNLAILFALTALTDFLTVGGWTSLGIFLRSLGIT